jgi:hypothetical protein
MKSKALFGLAVLATLCFLALTGTASAQTGFAWACLPSTSSYDALTVCAPYVYNSRGGDVKITRSSPGNYQVDFVGLGGRTVAGGNVQVTAYGGFPNIVCGVISWGSGGADFIANVRCFRASTGVGADMRFDILVGWFGQ